MGKYPSPEEARSKFESGVESAREKWVQRAKAGATMYQTWYTGFANTIYPLVAGLPDKSTLTIEQRVVERVTPIAKAVHGLSVSYQATKIRKIAEKARVVV